MAYFQYELWQEWMRKDLSLVRRMELFSDMHRGIKNHTIMRFFDRHVLDDRLTGILERNGFEWNYGKNFGTDKPKYAPIIFSALRRNGKRTSIESRYSFNYFAKHNPEVLMRYIKIMEQTDWNNTFVKGNLAALFELSCRFVSANRDNLSQGTYWQTTTHATQVRFDLPTEVKFLEKFKPELLAENVPEIMINGKPEKPKFNFNIGEAIAYAEDRQSSSRIP